MDGLNANQERSAGGERRRGRERGGGEVGGGGYALRRSLEGAQGSCRAAVLGAPLPAAAALVPVPPFGASIACNGRVISPSWGVLCLAPAPARLRAPLAPPPLSLPGACLSKTRATAVMGGEMCVSVCLRVSVLCCVCVCVCVHMTVKG